MADTKDNSNKPFHYRYPLTKLESSDDYLKITVLEYKAPGFNVPEGFVLPTAGEVGGYSVSQEKGTIILPIPDDVNEKTGATWGQSNMGPIEAGILAFGQNSIEKPTEIPQNISKILNNLLGVSQTGTGQRTVAAAMINAGKNILLGGDESQSKIVSRYAGAIANSNIELIFTSVNLREPFGFAFDIAPRSQKEAQEVKQIIRSLKKYSAPKRAKGTEFEGLFIKAPDVFKIEYMSGNKRHPYLNRFKICALNGMSVNYTPSNTYATYADGAPVNMILGLSFQELTPIYSEDYDTDIGSEGMGY